MSMTKKSYSNMFNSSRPWIDIVLTKDGIHTLVDIVIANPTRADHYGIPKVNLITIYWGLNIYFKKYIISKNLNQFPQST
jgi:hypothetical protein